MLKFPYGICDFYNLITENYFFVDRTDHIRLIEEFGKHLLFLRPRRFGKSLLLSMLENYYDVAKAEEILVTESVMEEAKKFTNVTFEPIDVVPPGAKSAYKVLY